VVVGEAVEVVVEGVEPGGGQDAGLAHGAAHAASDAPGLSMASAVPARRDPTGQPRPLERVTMTVSAVAAKSAGGDAAGDGGVPESGAVHVDGEAVLVGDVPDLPQVSRGVILPPAVLWVFSTQIREVWGW
jgi:hypothetical protein